MNVWLYHNSFVFTHLSFSHFVYLYSKWMCFICSGAFPLSNKACCPHHHHISRAVTSALFCIRRTSISNPLSHSHPFPLLCLNPHTYTHSPHTHKPPSSLLLDHVGETVALNLSSSSPHQSSVITTNPQHTPPSLCMQAFPWQLWCGGVCLATRRLSLLPIWLMAWGFADWAGWRLIAAKYLMCISCCSCKGQGLKKGSLQLHASDVTAVGSKIRSFRSC